mmetsp:Transcript_10985/g.10502  ORF Transcript_10985/g.10502 Transcript_10985/m.10502 type:complete len:323 (-) Transcript_10985:104-1072(-)|eukprot:CAMPEP_0197823088 /NCGR_PEP_ID=MMETSP1437-20131217/416_1 /TAXON_ID=49252 ORGANISM="Eucampia antarctica, Strain CCMP1452" /NCGR_SAMPLE_ID=MMETSP1437 /ASSEMBLY_ACC=CAM_ASM_001096 /LENGTH=322 /DNA_ID=CAMNT_0043422069 /DNA_START=172 /DNA_END=1140 /DNA_ORIENTATION=+
MKFLNILAPLVTLSATALAFSPNNSIRRLQSTNNNNNKLAFERVCRPLFLADEKSSDEKSSEGKPGAVVFSKPPVEEGSHEELMYTLGVNLSRQLGDVRPLVESAEELSLVAKGLLDALVGRFNEEGQIKLLKSRKSDLDGLINDRAGKIRKRMEDSGAQMLKTMSETEGVQTLDSGVCVDLLEKNPEGQRPTASSSVKVHYHGTLPDGTVFDSTIIRADDEPVTFALAQVIPGWKEGLQKMREGETAMIGIPPHLAYGEVGTPDGRIPGMATIFFKVQLLEVLSAGIGGSPTLVGSDGKKLGGNKGDKGGSGLLGADGNPL